jgi:hypothetical protein
MVAGYAQQLPAGTGIRFPLSILGQGRVGRIVGNTAIVEINGSP